MMQRWARSVGGLARRGLCTSNNKGAEAKKGNGLLGQIMEGMEPMRKATTEFTRQAADQAKTAADSFQKAAVDKGAKSAASGAGSTKAGGSDGAAGAKAEPSKSIFDHVKSAIHDVKAELLEDSRSVRADGYKPGQARGLRREATGKNKEVEVNTDATGLKLHKDSQWYKQWESFRENNKFVQSLFGIKMRFDESENIVIRGIRSVTERIEDSMQGEESEMLQVLTSIKRVDPYFNKEDFIVEVEKHIFPGVLESLFKGDLKTLEKWCNEPSYALLKSIVEGTDMKTRMTKIVDIGKTDLVTAMYMSESPVLVFSSRVQTVEMERNPKTGESVPNENDKVIAAYYILALSRDVERFDSEWEIVELAVQQEEGNFI